MTARDPRVLVVDDQPKTVDFLRRHAPDLPVVLTTAHEEIPVEDEARWPSA